MSEPKTPSFHRISGDLALSTRKSLTIAIVRFWWVGTFEARSLRGFPSENSENALRQDFALLIGYKNRVLISYSLFFQEN